MSFEDYGGEKEGLKDLREPLIQEVDMQQIFRRIKLELGKVKELNQSAKQVLDVYEANQGVDGRKGRQKLEQIFNQKSDEEISDFEHLLKGLKEAEEYIKEMEGKCKEEKLNKLKEMDRTYRHQAEILAKEYEHQYNRFLSQEAKQEIPKADIRSKMYQRTNYDDENPDPIHHSQKDQAVSILTAEERKTRVEAEIEELGRYSAYGAHATTLDQELKEFCFTPTQQIYNSSLHQYHNSLFQTPSKSFNI